MNFTHLLSPVQILLSLSFECATKISILFALVCLSKSDKTIGIEEQFSNIVFAIQYFPFLWEIAHVCNQMLENKQLF